MASAILKRTRMMAQSLRSYASISVGSDVTVAAPNVSLQKARSWDEGVSSKFSTTPIKDIFKGKNVVIFGLPGAYTGVCSMQHVPSYKNNIDKFKAKGIDSVICVAVNDPYTMNGWAEKLQAKDAHIEDDIIHELYEASKHKLCRLSYALWLTLVQIEFYGDFDGSFHKSLDLTIDLSAALLGLRSHRWSAYVVDGNVKVLNVEEAPSDFKVSGGDVILGQI
ncbi:peroxiredoxin-2F, mitochondrial isoform X1 [Solanum lycopersicum]|uniref:peroxiredoxin-2F, mitochondrial isoform X1 n=1 Tax=Solanum lycopersicum TaxID=4081 RepID=UPI0008FED117|nr:peroxiredoxin-2F, mitochondrial isoform X1 [Solanum lycopersicum]